MCVERGLGADRCVGGDSIFIAKRLCTRRHTDSHATSPPHIILSPAQSLQAPIPAPSPARRRPARLPYLFVSRSPLRHLSSPPVTQHICLPPSLLLSLSLSYSYVTSVRVISHLSQVMRIEQASNKVCSRIAAANCPLVSSSSLHSGKTPTLRPRCHADEANSSILTRVRG